MLSVKKLCLDSGIRVKRHALEYGIFQGMKPADNVHVSEKQKTKTLGGGGPPPHPPPPQDY